MACYVKVIIAKLIYDLAGLNVKYGRNVIQKFGPDKLLNIVESLLEIAQKELDASQDQIKTWRRMIKRAAENRDQFAHGVWLQAEPNEPPYLQLTRGEHPEEVRTPEMRARKIDPVTLIVTVPYLKSLIQELTDLIAELPRIKTAAMSPRSLPQSGDAEGHP